MTTRHGDRGPPHTFDRTRASARGDELTGLRHALTSWAHRQGLPSDIVRSIELASYEAMANVVEHAYGDSAGELRLTATAHPNRLDVAVSDHGQWRGPRADPDGGMGITLIQRLADYARIEAGERGTVVSMTWFRN
jgi:serine/threonine-protein kinase RsbW